MRFARLFVLVGGALTLSGGAVQAQTQFPAIQVPATPPARKAPAAPIPAPAETPLPGLGDQAFAGDEQADPNKSIVLDNADSFQQTVAGKWTGLGHVRVRYKDYVLTSDRVDVDMNTGEALFTGNVVLKAPNGQTVEGGRDGSLRLNLRRSTYTVSKARTTVPPSALDVGIILPVFLYGGEISGRPGLIDARGTRFTTCDFLVPHYSFLARSLTIIPDRRLVARHVTLYRKNRPLITIPYFFVPLDRRFARQTLFPQVGETPDEGYFAKFAIGYALASALPGIFRLDLMQKKGVGTGFEQNYGSTDPRSKGPSGVVSLYHLYDQSQGLENINGSINHKQTFGTVQATLSSQFQQNSYYAGQGSSKSQNSQLNLVRNVGNLDTSLRTNLSESNYGTGQTQTLTSAFDQIFTPTGAERLETRFDFSDYQSPSFGGVSSSRRELDSNLDYSQRGKKYDLELLGTKYTHLGSSSTGGQFFGGVERLPELRLGTDAKRQEWLSRLLPSAAMNLSLGQFSEPTSRTDTQRARFGFDMGTVTHKLDSRDTIDLSGSYQQGFYGDNTAQYVLNGRAAYRLRIGSQSSAGVTYTYLRPYGFSPFQFDITGNINTAALSYSYQETKKFRLSLATSYDFNQIHGSNGFPAAPWQNLAAQMLIAPNTTFQLRSTAAYDINHERLLDLTNYVRIRTPGGIALDLGTRFAPEQHKFSNINGTLDLPFFRDPHEDAGWRLRAIGGYNGFTSKFEYKGLALTRSWHDWEATLVYQDDPMGLRPGSTITFNFSLKAFPAYQPFAIGQFGQSLDPGLGAVY